MGPTSHHRLSVTMTNKIPLCPSSRARTRTRSELWVEASFTEAHPPTIVRLSCESGKRAPIVNQNRGLGLILARRDHWLGERWLNAATWTSNLHLRCPIPNTDATHYTLRDIVWYCVVLHDIPQHRCHSLRERSYHRDPAIKDDQQSFYGTGEQIGKGCNERAAPEMIYTKADPLNFKLLYFSTLCSQLSSVIFGDRPRFAKM